MKKEYLQLREKLLFKTPAQEFKAAMENYRTELGKEFNEAPVKRKEELANILSEITIDLQSYLTRWHLQKPGDEKALTTEEIDAEADKNYALLTSLGYREKVEKARTEVESIRNSNLVKLSQKADRGILNNRWGNDYASGLTASLRKGGIMVTTNPQLVNVARKDNPKHWDKVRDELKAKYPDKSPEELATLMTMEVVLENCREMRPIYEITKGELGYVSLQVNPKNYTDADGMVNEAEFIYNQVAKALGGTPNMIFKVPATKAALDAVRRLTKKGIGVNVTVNFAAAQEIAFAEAIEEGNAKVSVLTIMSGRLDDPIRDELDKM
ncbi:MAG: transaldolase, partial [Clostridiales bacterium]|nr:transaldolase [Clostridiales bacterium]